MLMGFVPLWQRQSEKTATAFANPASSSTLTPATRSRISSLSNDHFSQASKALYEKELAKGISENEEIFTSEESVRNGTQPQ
jgi:hypothetical protein